MYHPPSPFILASASPRRDELLTRAGFTFEVIPAHVDERRQPGEEPSDYVQRLALAKAETVARDHPDRLVLGADTVVVLDRDVFGKPRDDAAASVMLRRLSGRVHQVLTGVALVAPESTQVALESTRVTLGHLDAATIAWYVGTGEPRDKAGAYGVQGLASRFVERVDGSYTNVVGLPVARTARMITRASERAAPSGRPARPSPL